MKVKVTFECEIYSEYTPWFAVNNELKHINLECVEDLKVYVIETDKEL